MKRRNEVMINTEMWKRELKKRLVDRRRSSCVVECTESMLVVDFLLDRRYLVNIVR